MATYPRLDIPSTMKKPGPWVVQHINPSSDGDSSKLGAPPYQKISNDPYRVKIGAMWAEQKGIATPGINYYLDRLPSGYRLMDYPKGGDESVRYKRLFGHPSGRFYDSQVRFFPHFLWLMAGMKGECQCVLCNKNNRPAQKSKEITTTVVRGPRPPPREMSRRDATIVSGKRAKPVTNYFDKRLYENKGRRSVNVKELLLPTDEEGTPDIYKKLVQDLYQLRGSNKIIEKDLKEKVSPDWRAEHVHPKYDGGGSVLPSHLANVALQHSFVPRIGELVLWCPDHPDDVDIVLNPEIQGFQFYSSARKMFHGFPRWRAGVITQCPITDEHIDFPDILSEVRRKDGLNQAGFRVETFPDPNNNDDKTASKQYKYVPLRQIRPLNLWQVMLHGIPQAKLDASIEYALTCMVTVSLVERVRFAGKWPEASIYCRGIYIGPELLIERDAVRICPEQWEGSHHLPECTDILVVSSIRLHLDEIKKEHIQNDSPLICGVSSISLVGRAYTLDPSRDYRKTSPMSGLKETPQPIPKETLRRIFPTVGAAAYGDWYDLQPPGRRYEISHDRVLGRLYESGAVGMWTGTLGNKQTSKTPPSLSYDLSGVLAGRRYGTQTDDRIPEAPPDAIRWFWADTRVQALSLETVNGIDVGAYHQVRDRRTLCAWRARMKIVDGTHSVEDIKDSMLGKAKGRPRGNRVVGGVLIGPDELSEEEEEALQQPQDHFSAAVRSKAAGGMVEAGAALEGEDEEEDDGDEVDSESGDDTKRDNSYDTHDTDEDEPQPVLLSKVKIMKPKPEWKAAGFVFPHDPDVEMRPAPPVIKGSTRDSSVEFHGPAKARKSTGIFKLSTRSAGGYDNSITPAMTQSDSDGMTGWKGKGRADDASTGSGKKWDPDTPFRSVERNDVIVIEDDDDSAKAGSTKDNAYEEDKEADHDESEWEGFGAGLATRPAPEAEEEDEDYDKTGVEEEEEEEEEPDEEAVQDTRRRRYLSSFQARI